MLFCFFPTWLGAEIKAQKLSQARLACDAPGPCGLSASGAGCPGHQEVTWRRVTAVCVAAKWGPEATLAAWSYIRLSWLWDVPTLLGALRQWGVQWRSSCLNKLQPQPEAVSEVVGAGDGRGGS